MNNTNLKLSTTALAVSLVLMSFSNTAASTAITVTEKSTGIGNWDEATQTFTLSSLNAPATKNTNWSKQWGCDTVLVRLNEGSTLRTPSTSDGFNLSFAKAKNKTQKVEIQNPLKLFRWRDDMSQSGIFRADSDNKSKKTIQTIELANIDSFQLVETKAQATQVSLDLKTTSKGKSTFFLVTGNSTKTNTFSEIKQEISGESKIGTMTVVSQDGTSSVAGSGLGFYLHSSAQNNDTQSSIIQTFDGTIENLGTEAGPMHIGVMSRYVTSSTQNVPYQGLQEINEIVNLYATQGGVSFSGGHGSQTQYIHKIGQVTVSGLPDKYRMIFGLLNHSNLFADAPSEEGKGQIVEIMDSISVSGVPSAGKNDKEMQYISNHWRTSLVAGIVNFGGRQTINSLNEGRPVTVTIGESGEFKKFGVLVTPFLDLETKSAAEGNFLGTTITELKGSFRIEGGDVAVLGHRFGPRSTSTKLKVQDKNQWTKISEGGITLKLTPSESGNQLILGKNSNLYISPKTAANGYNPATSSFLASYEQSTGLGVLDPNASDHFVLEAGSAEKPSVITFAEPTGYVFVDGTLKGNAAFEYKASMVKQEDGGFSLNVNKNPVVIKKVAPGSSINFLVNYDVDKGNKTPVAQNPERSNNDFAHLYLMKGKNSQILIKDVVNQLILGEGALENLAKNEKMSLVAYDRVNKLGVDANVTNAANQNNIGAVDDRTARGSVTVNVAEGILIPAQSYVGDFYMENSANVGVVPEALKEINNDIRRALYGIDGDLTDPVEEAKRAKVPSRARARMAARSAAEPYAAEDEEDSVDSVLNSFGSTAQAQITSPEELKIETVTSKDVYKDPSCEELGNCPKGDDEKPKEDNPTEEKPSPNNPQGKPNPVIPKPEGSAPSGKTSSMEALESVGIANYFIWRESTEALSQRMGEVRMTPELEGMWVRTIIGKNKYTKNGNYLNNKFYGLTLGLDRNIGGVFGWTVGGSFEYIHGNGKLANSGKDKNWLGSLSLYATKQFESLGYLDIVFKASRMHNDFTAISDEYRYINKGAYHTFGYQIGAEYGKQFFLSEKWFVEPQIQLTYGHINSVTYKTDTGVKAKVKAINSLIGRAGIQTGYRSDKLESFVRIDGLRDFTAKYKVDYALGPVANKSQINLKDTWGEVSAGTTVNFGKNVKGFAQVKRSFAAKVKQEYRADIGLRIVF